ncbi:Ras GTPase-activating protein [Entamoeba marina]
MSRTSIFKKKIKEKEPEINIPLTIPDTVRAPAMWNTCRLYDYHVVSCIIRTCSVDAVPFWNALRDALKSDGALIHILKKHIEEEVINTKTKPQLFRVNGGITHLMSAFMRVEGQNILTGYVDPIIRGVNLFEKTLEIDPSKVDQDVADQNVETLFQFLKESVCQFNHLGQLVSDDMKEVFQSVKDNVQKKWPENKLIAVGGFVFLRFINPALIAPQRYSSQITMPNGTGSRTLLLIIKILQAIANQPSCPFKEDYMVKFSEFVPTQYPSLNQFLDEISTCTAPQPHEHELTDGQIIKTVPTIIKGIGDFDDRLTENFFELLDGRPGIRARVSAVIASMEHIKTYGFLEQNAALNTMFTGLTNAVKSYEREINCLNERIIDLYVKIGDFYPECDDLDVITSKLEEKKRIRGHVFGNFLSNSQSSQLDEALGDFDHNIIENKLNLVDQNTHEDVVDTSVTQKKVDEWSYNENDVNEFLNEIKTQLFKNSPAISTSQQATNISVTDYNALVEKKQQQQISDEMETSLKELIHTIYRISHYSNTSNSAVNLYQTVVSLVAVLKWLNGEEFNPVHKPNSL